MRRPSALLVAVAAGLALADASIVALALPPILSELDTTITGVAAVVGVYTLVLAVGIPVAGALARRAGPERVGAVGLGVFAAASAGCAAAPSLGVLLALRAVQAAGGAAGLLAAFDVLGAGESEGAGLLHGRRLWLGAALVGTAAGPAIGGALTEALDWRAIFAVQAPVAAAAALACLRLSREGALAEPGSAHPGAAAALSSVPAPAGQPARSRPSAPLALGHAVALALVSAAFTAVLFLLVLELVAGFAISPLRAAAGVTVLPVAAIVAGRVKGPPRARAAAGSALVAGGAAALAFLPGPSIAWTVAPQLLAGAGMGLALPALAGELLPERTAADAARLLIARHVGIVVVLLILAPVVSARLESATDSATLQGTALVLDAKLPPDRKIDLAPKLLDGVGAQRPRAGLQEAIARERPSIERKAVYDRLAGDLDDVLVAAVLRAFRIAYLVVGGLALIAAALLAARAAQRTAPALAAAAAAACLAAYGGAAAAIAPDGVELRNPCLERPLPDTGGVGGFIQDSALILLDNAACRFGSTREELVLALADPDRAQAYERKYGVDPRSATGILNGLFG